MKTNIFLTLLIFGVVVFNACRTENPYANDDISEREFMTMFRIDENTGKGEGDELRSRVVNLNNLYLAWYGVNGAAGYRIKLKLQSGNWDRETDILRDTVVGPDVLKLTFADLQYNMNYSAAIQVLSTRGEEYNSLWYGLGGGAGTERLERAWFKTDRRLGVPTILSKEGTTKTSVRIIFDLNADKFELEYPIDLTLDPSFEIIDGKFVIHEISIEPQDNKSLQSFWFELTPEDMDRGFIDVEGLTPNATYIVNVWNNHIKRYWDRQYNTVNLRMRGDPGEPIPITHVVYTADPTVTDQVAEGNLATKAATLNACRINQILTSYMTDESLVEGTEFILEPGKTYFIQGGVQIVKGLTLKCEDPVNRATVILGLYDRSDNFEFGRAPREGDQGAIDIGSIVFENIKFDAINAQNLAQNPSSATGNYFFNQNSSAMAYFCESIEVRNCDFRRIVRGWIRFQNSSRKIVKRIVVDKCLFYDCGYYVGSTSQYGFFDLDAGCSHTENNCYGDVTISNNSFIDSPFRCMFRHDNNASLLRSPWNITIENNTFLNWNTTSTGRYLISAHNNAPNSHFTIRKNLFVQTKSEGDYRLMHLQALDVTITEGVVFDVHDNYSTNLKYNQTGGIDPPIVLTGGVTDIFSANGFSGTQQGAGLLNGTLNLQGMEGTYVKIGTVGISPTDLMDNPNPLDIIVDTNYPPPNAFLHNMEGIYYKNTEQVRNHEIYKENIGDPRWRKNVTP